MKTLFLVRHAKSSWDDSSIKDLDRPLNNRGKADAPFMGNLLKKKNVNPDILISSPAKRAYSTAKLFAKELGIDKNKILVKENIYEASAGELIEIINDIKNEHFTAMLFGHNPGFTMLSYYLSNARVDNIPTCGVVKIIFDVESWKEVEVGRGTLTDFEFPKKYRDSVD
ncbi:MAG: histidine phosphatase family protein [Bacteroidetes bacterium]|nr:histidine phosphatase family protein [Bacteroidota bacterium]